MSGKIALITGGNRGLGKSAIQHLARKGIDTLFTYRSHKEEADQLTAEVADLGAKAVAVHLDVADSSSFTAFAQTVQTMLEQHWDSRTFDYLVNNAGTGLHRPFTETSEEQFDSLMNIHLKGPFFLTQKLLPLMADGGRIINISSGLARFTLPGSSAYATMKGGMEVLTRYMAKELGPRGIAVNIVAPGAIETDFNGGMVRDNTQLNEFVASQTALGRAGLADDIGGLIAVMLADETRWVTGQRIEASGGMFL